MADLIFPSYIFLFDSRNGDQRQDEWYRVKEKTLRHWSISRVARSQDSLVTLPLRLQLRHLRRKRLEEIRPLTREEWEKKGEGK